MLNKIADERPPPKRRLVGGSLRIEGVGATELHDYFNAKQPGFFIEACRSAGVDIHGDYHGCRRAAARSWRPSVAGVNEIEAEQEKELAAEGAVPESA